MSTRDNALGEHKLAALIEAAALAAEMFEEDELEQYAQDLRNREAEKKEQS